MTQVPFAIVLPLAQKHYDPENEARMRRDIELGFKRLAQAASTGGGGTGGGGGGGGVPASADLQETTSSVANLGSLNGDFDLGYKSAHLLLLTVDEGCWLRFYGSSAARTADQIRTQFTDPEAGIGVLGEFVFAGGETIAVSPDVFLTNSDNPRDNTIYYRLTNQSGGTTTFVIDMTILPQET